MTSHTSATDQISDLLNAADACLQGLDGPEIAEVRAGISEFGGGDLSTMPRSDNSVVDAWLPRCLQLLETDHPVLAGAIAAAAPRLLWISYDAYDPELIGHDFATSHAYASIIGEKAPLSAPDFDFGLFLIAPHALYRDHCHPAPELYLPLTGPHGWRFKPNAPLELKPAFEPVWNKPGVPHLTKVGPEPFLCLYCWTRENDKPAVVLPANDWDELTRLKLAG